MKIFILRKVQIVFFFSTKCQSNLLSHSSVENFTSGLQNGCHAQTPSLPSGIHPAKAHEDHSDHDHDDDHHADDHHDDDHHDHAHNHD